jgi:hypothetical protein
MSVLRKENKNHGIGYKAIQKWSQKSEVMHLQTKKRQGVPIATKSQRSMEHIPP